METAPAGYSYCDRAVKLTPALKSSAMVDNRYFHRSDTGARQLTIRCRGGAVVANAVLEVDYARGALRCRASLSYDPSKTLPRMTKGVPAVMAARRGRFSPRQKARV
jgi:hypothetical protein